MSLLKQIIAEIEAAGPMRLDRYMELCNTHYYATRDPLGKEGDFTTAPEISQIFGELLGAWVADQWLKASGPKAVLVELGPGRGTLMKDALRATKNVPGFHDALQIVMVETSPVLRAKQQQNLADVHPRITWQDSIENLPPLPLYFLANEFFDALPIRQGARGKGQEWQEQQIVHRDGALHFTLASCLLPLAETCEPALAIMQQLATHIRTHGGGGLIIDYGYTGGSRADTLQALKMHTYANILENPGEQDLTAHVDFDALANAANGLQTAITTQGDFLRSLGAELRAMQLCKNADVPTREKIASGLARLMSPVEMGELFKVIVVTNNR